MSTYTVGVEEEYQLVDPGSGDLRSSARPVLGGDWSGDIRREMQDSTIEIGTQVCGSSAAALADLKRLRLQAATAAAAEELNIVAAGLHPFSDWREQAMSDGDRYRDMAQLYGRIARDEHNYGMHVHVAVDGDRMRLLNTLRHYIPHLLALSCSSPYYEGEDTGYASYRMVLWRRWPGAGPPPRLESDEACSRYIAALLSAGVLPDERSVYWLIRRHPEYPTVEFRMCDVCTRVEDAAAIAGLARVLVAAAAEDGLAEPAPADWTPEAVDAALSDDCWRAARHGLDACLVTAGGDGAGVPVRDALLRLLDGVQRTADALGEDDVPAAIETILRRGTAADRARAFNRECADLRLLVAWLQAETMLGVGMDRRRAQRHAVDCG
jgi:glutamate---cysteine ligase / carboxylate-amine ligase